jgi:hypothetical protein
MPNFEIERGSIERCALASFPYDLIPCDPVAHLHRQLQGMGIQAIITISVVDNQEGTIAPQSISVEYLPRFDDAKVTPG